MRDPEYHSDDPDTAAKKAARDLKKEGWCVLKDKNKDDNDSNEPKPKIYTAYKYSKGIPLAEEISLGSKNVYLQIINGDPVITSKLDLKDQNIIIKPHDRSENTPIIPYTFKDKDEIKYFIEQAKKETIHTLYFKSKSLWKCFVVAKDSDTITLLAVDRKFSKSERIRENKDMDSCLKYPAEREKRTEHDVNDSNPLSSENRPISVPSSPFACYHNGCEFSTEDETEYRSHWHQKHVGVPILYPTRFELEKYGLKPQGKKWEI